MYNCTIGRNCCTDNTKLLVTQYFSNIDMSWERVWHSSERHVTYCETECNMLGTVSKHKAKKDIISKFWSICVFWKNYVNWEIQYSWQSVATCIVHYQNSLEIYQYSHITCQMYWVVWPTYLIKNFINGA